MAKKSGAHNRAIQKKGKAQEQTAKTKKAAKAKVKAAAEPLNISELPAVQMLQKFGVPAGLILVTIACFWVFSSYLFGDLVFLFSDIGSDSINIKYPRVQLLDWLRASSKSLEGWSFYHGMGQSVGSGANHWSEVLINLPERILRTPFEVIGQLAGWGELPMRLAYDQLVDLWLSGIFGFLFFRHLTAGNVLASILGALFLTFSGYMVMGSTWLHSGFKYIFLLWAFEEMYRKNRWYFVPIALTFFRSWDFYFGGMFIFLYSIARYFADTEKSEEKSVVSYVTFGMRFLAVAGLGIAMSLGTITHNMDKINKSPRGEGVFNDKKISRGDAGYVDKLSGRPIFGMESSVHYDSAVMRLFSSDALGSGSEFKGWRNYLEAPNLYAGILTLLLLVQFFFLEKKRSRIFFGAFVGLWLLMVAFPFFRYAFYLFVGDYYKHALNYFIPFTLVIVGALGLKAIMDQGKVNLPALGGTALLLLILAQGASLEDKGILDEGIALRSTVFILGYSAALFALTRKNLATVGIATLVVLTMAEVGLNSKGSLDHREVLTKRYFDEKKGYNDYTLEAVSYIDSIADGFTRIEKNYSSAPSIHASMNDAQAQRYFGTQSYSSMNQSYYIRFLQEIGTIQRGDEIRTRWAPGLKYTPLLHSVFQVNYTMRAPRFQLNNKSLQLMQNNGVPPRIMQSIWQGQSMVMDQEDFIAYLQTRITDKQLNRHFQKIAQSCIIANPNYEQFGYRVAAKKGDVEVLRNEYPVPFGFVYDKKVSESSFEGQPFDQKIFAMNMACVLPDSNLSSTAASQFYIDSIPQNYTWDFHGQNTAKLAQDHVNWTEVNDSYTDWNGTVSSDGGILFFSIPFDEDWTVEFDGEKQNVLLANFGFMGVELPSGETDVHLSYAPANQGRTHLVETVMILLYLGLVSASIFGRTTGKLKGL